jgi:hypothetical protein
MNNPALPENISPCFLEQEVSSSGAPFSIARETLDPYYPQVYHPLAFSHEFKSSTLPRDAASKLITLKSNPIHSSSTSYYSTHFPDEDPRLYHPSSIIFTHATFCLYLFRELLNSETLVNVGRNVPLSRWKDELGRLRIWCSSTGVYLEGDSTLDYRIHDSPHLKDPVVRQLDRLRRALRDLQSIPEMLQASDSDTESEEESTVLEDEIQETYSDLLGIVSGLFGIAIMIQKPTFHNLLSSNGGVVSSWRDND